ncbi:coiled-coil domain-containing protein 22 isoform X1 [Gallus gallus]|uniref:coiled-coil domain-containing protein 22 isoform X1 n=1 Tax=Gallus gallus TaxID=9031 RepID=UPI001F01CD72|nr:coiled-coil domain-containing protein 22 isoform X1 [Gallus gallus]
MEEVDKILIHSLRQVGTPVPPEVQSVRELSAELVVEAAVRCLRAVRPALGGALSPHLPPGISARFRLASDLAAACQVHKHPPKPPHRTPLHSFYPPPPPPATLRDPPTPPQDPPS